MKHRNLLALAFVLVFSCVAANGQTVTGSFDEATVSRGSSVEGSITLSIPEGLHVNSNKPNSEYAIPTTVRVSGVGLKPGTVEYPAGTDRKFQFSESELNVYEGEVKIPFIVAVPKNFRRGTLTVKAVVRYQACTEEVCYPPKNKEVVMTAVVK